MTSRPDYDVKHLVFDADLRGNQRPHLSTVIFHPESVDPYGSVESQLSRHFATGRIPSTILLLGLEDLEEDLIALAQDPGLARRVSAISQYQDTPDVRTAAILPDGRIRVIRGTKDGDVWTLDESRRLFQAGLASMFSEHGGLINSSSGYHFIKPSGSHAEFFLRGASVLMSSREIHFVAASLISYLPAEGLPDVIYTDTSSINSVGLALSAALKRLTGSSAATVESFGSYSGLAQDAPRPQGNAICLVSASTSGKLSEEITRKTGVPRDRHMYLYYLGPAPNDLKIACDLTDRHDNPGGTLPPIKSWQEADCPHCRVGHPTVELIGDSFFPASPAITARMIAAADAPEWLSPFVESVYGLDALRCHYSNSDVGIFEASVHVALEPVIRPSGEPHPKLSDDLRRQLQRSLPAATSIIIHLRDGDSTLLAEVAREMLVDRGIDENALQIVSASDLVRAQPFDMPDGIAFVAASASATSRSLLEVSQALRHLHPGGAITYFVLLARMPNALQWAEARSNLSYGNNRPNEHPVDALSQIELPPVERFDQNPWAREQAFWGQALTVVEFNSTLTEEGDPTELINDRLGVIAAATADGGLRDNLFLPSVIGGKEAPLRLRPNFAFWRFRFEELSSTGPEGGASQAEVYFTMHALLHSLRSGSRKRAAALSRDHIWTVLDPRNFARYNDGVIQAALLRAALPIELDYSTDKTLSRDMYRVLRPILFNRRTEEGAACGEVLLSLASQHLRLDVADLAELVSGMEQEVELPTLHRYLTAYIRQEVLQSTP
jgi:hypothetical protein